MAALILKDDRERRAGMLDRVVRALECFLEGFGDDGGCAEGIDYWVYGFGFYTYFADMLAAFTHGQLDLLRGEKVRRIALFPEAVSLGSESFINYSDAAEHATLHPGLGSYLSAYFHQALPELRAPNFHADHIHRWGHVTRDLLWTKAEALHAPITGGSFYLPDLAWVVERHTDADTTIAFSAKGGHNDEPHNHNDLGHFIVHLGGESLLADLGAGLYTRQYFGLERYDALHTSSLGHSVPVINGQTQQAGSNFAASMLNYERQPNGVTFILNLTRAYADVDLESFQRAFNWSVDATTHSATLRLIDTFRFTALPTTLEECFISLHAPIVETDTATWNGSRGAITLHFDRAQFEPHVEALSTQSHHGELLTLYRLCLRALQATLQREDNFVFMCHV